jgi:hypothetical protein
MPYPARCGLWHNTLQDTSGTILSGSLQRRQFRLRYDGRIISHLDQLSSRAGQPGTPLAMSSVRDKLCKDAAVKMW